MTFNYSNFDLLTIGLSIAAIGILGFVVFLQNFRSATNRAFLFAAILTGLYGSANYLNYQVSDSVTILWLIRIVVFFAVWHAFSFFYLFYVFPKQEIEYAWWFKFIVVPSTALTSVLTLTPLVFPSLAKIGKIGEVSTPEIGLAAPIFFTITGGLIVVAIAILIRKTLRAGKSDRRPYILVLSGTITSFSLLLLLNLILPVVFQTVEYVPLSGISMLPFITLTAYSVMRYKLLNVKIIGTEVTAFILTAVTLLQVINAETLFARVFTTSIFGLVLLFSFVLIKGVINEVRQREEIQRLAEDLKTANIKLKELDVLKSQFLSIASHDLRSPLTVIRNFLSMLMDGTYGKIPEAAEEGMKQVFDRATDMAKSVETYLNVSRIEQGRMEYDFIEVEVLPLLTNAANAYQPAAIKKGLKYEVDIDRSLSGYKSKIDVTKMNEVLNNLIDNSIKYTPTGTIWISAKKADNAFRFSVKDSGVGMSEDTIKNKLFKLFSTAENSRRVNVSSTGVGMYVAKAHAEAHKGKLWAESEGEGKGSTFILEVPISGGTTTAPFPSIMTPVVSQDTAPRQLQVK